MFRPRPYRRAAGTFSPRVGERGWSLCASLGLRIIGANTLLDLLQPGARCSATPRQGTAKPAGRQASTPCCAPRASVGELAACFEGWTLEIDHGIDERDRFVIGGSKGRQVRRRAEGRRHGRDRPARRFQRHRRERGRLAVPAASGRTSESRCTRRAAPPAAIDGSTEAFKADHPGAADGHGRPAARRGSRRGLRAAAVRPGRRPR